MTAPGSAAFPSAGTDGSGLLPFLAARIASNPPYAGRP